MSSNKEAGQLRDYRNDQAFSSKAKAAPRQETMLRASTLSEWSHNSPISVFDEEESEPIQEISKKLPELRQPTPQKITPAFEGIAVSTKAQSSWASQLALQERQMERQGTVDVHPGLNKQELLKSKTRDFLIEIQNDFRVNVELFNETRQSPAHHIHIYKVSQTPDDFMLYRNGVKLVVSGQRAGRILLAFNQYMGHLFSSQHPPALELQAAWGVLDQLYWTYKGERIRNEDLVRYLLSEFIVQSFK